MPITFNTKGDFGKITKSLERAKECFHLGVLDKYAREGVAALSESTPKRDGITSQSWYYRIENNNGVAKIIFYNSNVHNGVNVALLIQYGHATRTGGWVEGIDYVDPALRPIFTKIAQDAWKEVTE